MKFLSELSAWFFTKCAMVKEWWMPTFVAVPVRKEKAKPATLPRLKRLKKKAAKRSGAPRYDYPSKWD